MKFKKEHLEEIKNRVLKLDINVSGSLQSYYDNGIGKEPLTRFCFDLFFATKFSKDFRGECREYNDKHIETAMKKVIKDLISSERSLNTNVQ